MSSVFLTASFLRKFDALGFVGLGTTAMIVAVLVIAMAGLSAEDLTMSTARTD